MTGNWTPGPWSIHVMDSDGQPRFVLTGDWQFNQRSIGAGEALIASTMWHDSPNGGYPSAASNEEMLANANLIAAAPELFEVAQAMANFDGRNNNAALKEMARVAVNKALGK